MSNKNINQPESPYKSSNLYKTEEISVNVADIIDSSLYAQKQLQDKINLVEKYINKNSVLLDMGCGNGNTLGYFFDKIATGIGVDFSERYIEYACQKWREHRNLKFIVSDICDMTGKNIQVHCAYSFSTLYHLNNFYVFLQNLKSVLFSGGVAILDLGNACSLNALCCKQYEKEDGYAAIICPDISEQLRMITKVGFEIIERRSFQLLPLWAGKPRWLWPLLHPKWNDIMKKRIKGKMLDEWISSLLILRKFAFRHLVVCRKPEKNNTLPL